MEILLVYFGPAVLFWLLLALSPAGRGFVIALVIWIMLVVLLTGQAWKVPKYSGPDNWFAGADLVGLMLGLFASVGPLLAQGWRHWRLRQGKPAYYVAALLMSTVATAIVAFVLSLF